MDEIKGFRVTRGMVILGVLLLIVLIVTIFSVVKSIDKNRVTTASFIALEENMERESEQYLHQKKIIIDEGKIIKIRLSDLINSQLLMSSKVTKLCEGYVEIQNNLGKKNYRAFLNCGKNYISDGYKGDISKKTTKKSIGDKVAPVLKLNGDSTINLKEGQKFSDPGATAYDNIDGDITSEIVISGEVDSNKAGIYVLTYEVKDNSNNLSKTTRTVVVKAEEIMTTNKPEVITTKRQTETTAPRNTTRKASSPVRTTKKSTPPPVIILKGPNAITINQGDSFIDPGYSARDASGNDITSRVTIIGDINTRVPGTYNRVYNVIDSNRNNAVATRIVIVKSTSISLQSISVIPNKLTMYKGESISPTVYFSPSNATNRLVYWTSSSLSVVSVNSGGIITAKEKGSAIITIRSDDSRHEARIEIIVK